MIRPYHPNDTDAIIDVWFKASLIAHPFLADSFLEKEQENIRNIYLPNTDTWVYEKENQVVGFLSLMDNEVGAIFVNPAYHQQGIGKVLMDKAASLHTSLEVEVFKANSIGRAFYERYGFQFMKEHRHEATGHLLLRLSYVPNSN